MGEFIAYMKKQHKLPELEKGEELSPRTWSGYFPFQTEMLRRFKDHFYERSPEDQVIFLEEAIRKSPQTFSYKPGQDLVTDMNVELAFVAYGLAEVYPKLLTDALREGQEEGLYNGQLVESTWERFKRDAWFFQDVREHRTHSLEEKTRELETQRIPQETILFAGAALAGVPLYKREHYS
ncbi:MAG: hypothetical protein ACMXYK_03855 [Candidatus Woesearchaeota archaeon]